MACDGESCPSNGLWQGPQASGKLGRTGQDKECDKGTNVAVTWLLHRALGCDELGAVPLQGKGSANLISMSHQQQTPPSLKTCLWDPLVTSTFQRKRQWKLRESSNNTSWESWTNLVNVICIYYTILTSLFNIKIAPTFTSANPDSSIFKWHSNPVFSSALT